MSDKRITSLQNPRVKDAVRLRSARHRAKQRRILIDGAREISRAVTAGVQVIEAFICEPLCDSADCDAALAALRQSGCELWHVGEDVLDKLTFGERQDGVLAIANTPEQRLSRLQPRGSGPIVVLEGLEKPGNVGAVLRSADAAGVSAVIVADPATDLFNPNCIRASLGAVFTVPVGTATTDETLAWLRQRGVRILAARVDAELSCWDADLTGAVALVLGSEALGLSAAWHQADVTAIQLPMHGIVDSLNVSATAAVLFYEARRQRQAKG